MTLDFYKWSHAGSITRPQFSDLSEFLHPLFPLRNIICVGRILFSFLVIMSYFPHSYGWVKLYLSLDLVLETVTVWLCLNCGRFFWRTDAIPHVESVTILFVIRISSLNVCKPTTVYKTSVLVSVCPGWVFYFPSIRHIWCAFHDPPPEDTPDGRHSY